MVTKMGRSSSYGKDVLNCKGSTSYSWQKITYRTVMTSKVFSATKPNHL